MSKTLPIRERIERHIQIVESGCWEWQGRLDRYGYGRFSFSKIDRRAHRISYEEFVGPIPEGLVLDHLCRNRRCINPEHLEPVTNAENMRRSAVIQTHCKRGHEFTAENTYLHRNMRHCRACTRIRQSKAYREGALA